MASPIRSWSMVASLIAFVGTFSVVCSRPDFARKGDDTGADEDGEGGGGSGSSARGGAGGRDSQTGGKGGDDAAPGGAGGDGEPAGGSGGAPDGMGGAPVDTTMGAPKECSEHTVARVRVVPDPTKNTAAVSKTSSLTLEQKTRLMFGWSNCNISTTQCFAVQGLPAAQIPEWPMRDGPRGVRTLGSGVATAFPVAVARAASFDVDLERRIGEAMGVEMLALKYDLMLAPTVNTLRHPGWGRAQETYGEDTIVLGEMGAAYTLGVQKHVPTCLKHFAANTTDDNRETMSANMDEQTLREVYTRQFQTVIEKADPACMMAAYNKVNGTFSAENKKLLTDMLRTEWDWKGFVMSDWWAVKSTAPSANAGLDLEMPDDRYYKNLLGQVQGGVVKGERVTEAVLRQLNIRHHWKQMSPEHQSRAANPAIVDQQSHRQLAQEAAEKGMVLLENRDNVLPFKSGQKILVAGPDADQVRLGDRGSSNVNPKPAYVVTPYAGLRSRGMTGNVTVDLDKSFASAVAKAKDYDAVVLVVAMEHRDEGEGYDNGGDRDNLHLGGPHPVLWPADAKPRRWIDSLAAANPNLVVVLNVGSAVLEPSLDKAKALLYSFYPGQAGGAALARLLFGDVNFSGKLPFSIAADANDYPAFGNAAASHTYDFFHGYRKLDNDKRAPKYPFGAGISYTQYEYSNLRVACTDGVTDQGLLVVEVDVKNVGEKAGAEIVQLYIGYPNTKVRRAPKELKAFTRVTLDPGQTKTVQLGVPARSMAYWDTQKNAWAIEHVEHTVLVGPNADPKRLLSKPFALTAK